MAKLGAYYALCPLIGSKSLLGISEDPEKGHVILTVGKNISSRYKISDQKQISCWRTKEKFSSPVVYDKNCSKYVGVFNQSVIKLWDDEENVDKVRKYKFTKQIFTLISDGDIVYVVFNNGAIHKLEDALENRKELSLEGCDIDSVQDVIHRKVQDHFYIGLIVKSGENNHLHWTVCNGKNRKIFKTNLSREGYDLRGYVFHYEKNAMNLLTIWSDGCAYILPLEESKLEDNGVGEIFLSIGSVSAKYYVSVVSLDENYLALYGANCDEEGAILIIYNTQFKITQSRQPFKLFTEGSKLWCIENNLFLPVGQNLAVISFCLETEQLASLIGSHRVLQSNEDDDVRIVNELQVASWDPKYKIAGRDVPEKLKPEISDFVYQGLPEAMIVEKILPDILRKKDLSMLALVLQYFCDIPEMCLVSILKFLVSADKKHFIGNLCDLSGLPESLQPNERINLIDCVLRKPFSDVLLLPHLRSELSLEDVLLLLNYMYLLCSEDGYVLPSMNFVETEGKIIEWICVLIDSSYQKIVLSHDSKVKDVLSSLISLIDNHLNCLKDLNLVAPLLSQFKREKLINKDMKSGNLRYSIEQLSLY